jgi:hypothetical protein
MADPITGAFPSKLNAFVATNTNANLRRMRQRLKDLGELAKVPELPPENIGGTTIREEDNRIRLEFSGKPSADTIKALKAGGFVWSRSDSAWQRKLTPSNRDTVIQRARAIAQAEAPDPTRVSSATARRKGERGKRAVRAGLRKGARKAFVRPPSSQGTVKVLIEYGAEMNRNADASGWVPQLWIDGYPKLGTWSRKGYEMDRAIEVAKWEADQEEGEWSGDYRPTVQKRFPEGSAKVKPTEPVQTPKPTKPRRAGGSKLLDDERVILAVHQQLDTRNDNMTKLFDLRKETRIPRARFDAAIQSLRKQGRAYLESSQGQAVKLTAPQQAAGIEEDGRKLVYFSLR